MIRGEASTRLLDGLTLLAALSVAAFLTGVLPSTAALGWDLGLGLLGHAATRGMLQGGSAAVARLAVRAVPAVLLVGFGVLIAGAVLLPPDDLERQGWAAFWTATGGAGRWYARMGPFLPTTGEEPLNHLWIFGVGAQLTLCWTAAVQIARRRVGRGAIGLAAVFLAAASLALDMHLWLTRPAHEAFYGGATNAWPFLAGAALAAWRPHATGSPAVAGWAWAWTALLWPGLVLPRLILARPLEPSETAAIVLVSAGVALALERGAQRHLRKAAERRPWAALAACAAGLALMAGAGAALVVTDGAPGRAPAEVLSAVAAVREPPPLAGCHVEGDAPPPIKDCTRGAGTGEILVWGNSHAAHLVPGLTEMADARGLSLRQATKSGCLPLTGEPAAFVAPDCDRFNRAVLAEVSRRPAPRLIIVGGAWTLLAARWPGDDATRVARLERGMARTLAELRRGAGPGVPVLILGSGPEFAGSPAGCLIRRTHLALKLTRCLEPPAVNGPLAEQVDAALGRVAREAGGADVFSPMARLCPARPGCQAGRPGEPWFVDGHHMTPAGARALAPGLTASAGRLLDP